MNVQLISGFCAVRHLHVGQGDDANAAMWSSRCLSQMFHPNHPISHRRSLSAAKVYRLPSQRPQTGHVQGRQIKPPATAVTVVQVGTTASQLTSDAHQGNNYRLSGSVQEYHRGYGHRTLVSPFQRWGTAVGHGHCGDGAISRQFLTQSDASHLLSPPDSTTPTPHPARSNRRRRHWNKNHQASAVTGLPCPWQRSDTTAGFLLDCCGSPGINLVDVGH